GTIAIAGGSSNWAYSLERPQTHIDVIMAVGPERICGALGAGDLVQRAGRRVKGTSHVAPASCPCVVVFPSTWAAIQQVVFADHPCTQPICGGAAPGSGGLDLRPAVAYGNLIDVPSTDDPARKRVTPGSATTSMLWLKLAARTLKLEPVPLSPMPIGDPALSRAELDAVALWI